MENCRLKQIFILIITVIVISTIIPKNNKNLYNEIRRRLVSNNVFNLNTDDEKIFSNFNENNNTIIKPKVGIIGAGGYVGSKLLNFLHALNVTVDGYDRDLKISNVNNLIQEKSSSEISTTTLHSYDTVIYLGGVTGRIASEIPKEILYNENIDDVLNLVKRMKSTQTLIFASTSAIGEGSGTMPIDENSEIKEDLKRIEDKIDRLK